MIKFPDNNREMSIKTVENGFVVTAACQVEHIRPTILPGPPPSTVEREFLTWVFSNANDVLEFVEGYTSNSKERLR